MNVLSLDALDGRKISAYAWLPQSEPRGALQIVHGMAEHAARYSDLAQMLTAAGYAGYAQDLRGHGKTTTRREDLGYLGDDMGWRGCLDDLHVMRRRIAEDFPGLPVILLGHSMGSFLSQQFAAENASKYAGLVLSGSYRQAPTLARAGALLARLERIRLGRRGHSRLIRTLTFDAFNRRFAPLAHPLRLALARFIRRRSIPGRSRLRL